MTATKTSALDEIQERLNEIYNKIRHAREGEQAALREAARHREEIRLSEILAADYVALLAPTTQGETNG